MKKCKSLFAVFICFVILIGVYASGVNFYIIGSAQKYIYETENVSSIGKVDCVLVLGCGVKPDGTPSRMLYERVKKGVEVFKESDAQYLLLSGDKSGDYYDEPKVMKDLALEFGMTEDNIVTDNIGYSTYESIYNAKSIYSVEKVIIITQPYHLPRAVFIAKSLGLEVYGCEAYLPLYLKQVIWSAREILARNKDFLKCIFDEV